MLRYYMRVSQTALLGFGSRCALWVYGCSKKPSCPGCIASHKNTNLIKTESETEIARWICENTAADGITVSGGEPFDQAGSLAKILREVKLKRGNGFSIIVYTGHLYEELLARKDQETRDLLALSDILIDGPYIAALNDNIPYRGSSNQRILILNPAFQTAAAAYYTDTPGRIIDMIATAETTMLIGVPSADQAELWRTISSMTN